MKLARVTEGKGLRAENARKLAPLYVHTTQHPNKHDSSVNVGQKYVQNYNTITYNCNNHLHSTELEVSYL